jgi:Icc-related predicted phosphoesterase
MAKENWAILPEGLDILITHGPPAGILDRHFRTGEALGDTDLMHKLRSMKNPPKVHLFGHIHSMHSWTFKHGIDFINAAIVGEDYTLQYPATIFEYSNEQDFSLIYN